MKNVIFKLIVPLLGIVAMLAFVTFFNPVKQQNAAIVGNNGNLACGGAGTINLSFSDSCPTGVASLSSYQPSVTFSLNNSNRSNYFIDWAWKGFFCTAGNPAKCVPGAQGNPSSAMSSTDSHGDHQSLSSSVTGNTVMPSKGQFAGQVCGAWQYDMEFAVYHYNGSNRVYDCAYGVQDPINSPGSALYCHTNNTCSVPPTATPTVPVATATPTVPVATATPTNSPTPTATTTPVPPTATATPANTNNCGDNNQSGNNDNNNCNNNNNNNQQQQQQTQNNNQTVNISLGAGQQQQQQQVLGMTTLPKTGAEGDILFGLLALIPVGWKLRKLV